MSDNPLHDATWPSPEPVPNELVETWCRRLVVASIVLGVVGWYVFWVVPHDAALFNSM